MTIEQAIRQAINILRENNIESASLKAKIIMSFLINKPKEYLIINNQEILNKNQVDEYFEYIKKINEGTPLEHITNTREFMKLNFYVDENVLIPRQDTEILVEEVIKITNKFQNVNILDLCTGSGAIAISIAKYVKNCKILATDISDKALKVAKKNAINNNVNNQIDFRKSDLFENVKGKFNIIVSNPPYIKSEEINNLETQVKKEPLIALDGGPTGLEFYKKIINSAYEYIQEDGYLCLEIGYDQKEEVIELLNRTNRYTEINCLKDLENNDRVIIAKVLKSENKRLSFSEEVKEELSRTVTLNNKNLVIAELNGYLITKNTKIQNGIIKYSTENKDNIYRYNKLLKNLNIENQTYEKGKLYITNFEERYLNIINVEIESYTEQEFKAMARGSFMGAGSMNEPNKKYHLEIFFDLEENSEYFIDILKDFNINFKSIENKRGCSLYIKEGEEISKFLAFIGANNSVLKFEEIRVLRETRSNVNRIVNCETANINKIIKISVEQIEDIEFLIKINKFETLPENLKEVANLRLENSDASYLELGQMLKNKIGKSGVNHRLKKIQEIAKKYREE